jgi:hypothetical protein
MIENKQIAIKDYSSEFFINRIKNKEPFSYSRFNDGELLCTIKTINNNEVRHDYNCDGHNYLPQMGEELMSSLKNSNCDNYFIQYLDTWLNDKKFIEYTELLYDKSILLGVYQYSDFLQFMLRNEPDTFIEFVNILNKNKFMVVGPNYLKKIKFLKYSYFVEVPLKNCYNDKKNILKTIKENINDNLIILFSSSMATNVFIDELHKEYGGKIFLIDVGSLWDIFFYKSNPEIKQRSPNLNKLDKFIGWYKEFFNYG